MTHYTYWCGLIVHCGFLAAFLALDLRALALFNCASIAVYVGNLVLSRRGHLHLALFIGGLEVGLHQIFATLVLGTSAGFHFFLLILAFATLLYTHLPAMVRTAMAVFPLAVYVVLYTYCIHRRPDVELPAAALTGFAVFNLSAFVLILLGICYYFVHTARLAREAAEELARAKTLFLANMSHELRTPLNAILGFTKIVSRSPTLAEDDRRNLATIDRSGVHLLGLINGILDLSKLEAGRLELSLAPASPLRLLEDLRTLFSPEARRRGVTLSLEAEPGVPEGMLLDELKVRQILINLVGNALKFTTEGSVRVTLRPAAAGGADRGVSFTVEDTGPGMTPEELAHLFELFAQASAGRRAGVGTGLGLALSQRLATLMGSRIEVMSEPGRGSRFSFVLRGAEAPAPAPETAVHVGALLPGQAQKSVLVVDDHHDNRELLCRFHEGLGLRALAARGGAEAVELWIRERPDLVWMDLHMPEVDGAEAARRIQSLASAVGQRALIVALTASASPEQRALTLATGYFEDFLPKPWTESALAGVLTKHLGLAFETSGPVPAARATEIETAPQDAGRRLLREQPAVHAALSDAVASLDFDAALSQVEVVAKTDARLARQLREALEGYRFDTAGRLLTP